MFTISDNYLGERLAIIPAEFARALKRKDPFALLQRLIMLI
jgi:hypothetical protein